MLCYPHAPQTLPLRSLFSQASSAKVETIVSELKEAHNAKLVSMREAQEAALNRASAAAASQIAAVQRGAALEAERTRMEWEQHAGELTKRHAEEASRMQAALEAAERARTKALEDGEAATHRALSLSATQSSAAVTHLESLLLSERQQHARAIDEARAETNAAVTRLRAEHEGALRAAHAVAARAAEQYEARLSAAAAASAADLAAVSRERDEAAARLEARFATRQTEHDAAMAAAQASLASSRADVLDLTQRLQTGTASAKTAHMDAVLRLEARLSSQAAAHETALGEVIATWQRRIAGAANERDEALRGMAREVAAAREAGEVAVANEQLRSRDALNEAASASNAAVRALNARIESITSAHVAELEEVTRRLTAHAETVDADHEMASRTARARSAALEREIADLRTLHAGAFYAGEFLAALVSHSIPPAPPLCRGTRCPAA